MTESRNASKLKLKGIIGIIGSIASIIGLAGLFLSSPNNSNKGTQINQYSDNRTNVINQGVQITLHNKRDMLEIELLKKINEVLSMQGTNIQTQKETVVNNFSNESSKNITNNDNVSAGLPEIENKHTNQQASRLGTSKVNVISVFEEQEFDICGYKYFSAKIVKLKNAVQKIKIHSNDRSIPDIPFRGFEMNTPKSFTCYFIIFTRTYIIFPTTTY